MLVTPWSYAVTKKSLAVAGFSATATKIAVSFAALFFSFRDERWIEDKFTFMHGRIRG